MRDKKRLMWFIFFAFLCIFPTAIFAQDQLTQTYTSPDGKFTMSYPEGWLVDDKEEGLIGFKGDGALFQISFYDSANSGYAPVTALEMLESGIGKAPNRMSEFSEPEELVIAGYPALVSRSKLVSQVETVIDFGEGMLGTAIGFAPDGQLAAFEPTFMAMLESIHYGDGPQPITKTPLDDVKVIMPANTAAVSQLMTLGDAAVSVESLAFSPDGKWLAVGTSDGTVRLWDIASGESRMELTGNTGGVTSLAFGAGGYLLAVGTGSGEVRLWDATTGEASGTMQEHDTSVESVAFTNEFLVASGALDGSVKLWDVASRAERAELVDASKGIPVGSVAFSPDGTTLAVGSGSTIQLWDVESGTAQATLETEISDISTIRFRPDGASLVYGGADPAVWIWDLKDDNHALLDGHDGKVSALAFSPDGAVIASTDSGTLRLWDAAAGGNPVVLTTQAVNTVAFSPDGKLLASAGQAGGVVLWGATTDSGASPASTSPQSSGDTSEPAAAEETGTSAAACTITAPNNANLRGGPGTEFDRAGALSAGQTAQADGQAQSADGMTWYRLTDGAWVRSDIVGTPADCANLPAVTP